MNNFEKIKNMTLDEMASWLEYFVYAYTSGNICYEDENLKVCKYQ